MNLYDFGELNCKKRYIEKEIKKIKGIKVFDPICKQWSTSYRMQIYEFDSHIVNYVPVWREYVEK